MANVTEPATEKQVTSELEAAEMLIDAAEPWEDWETKLVAWVSASTSMR
jgi:hypothetical protein